MQTSSGGSVRAFKYPVAGGRPAAFLADWPACMMLTKFVGVDVSDENQKLSFLQVLGSVVSSFFGVQKNATRERDFKRGRARDFIFVGILLTLVFILAVWGVVQLVMSVAVKG